MTGVQTCALPICKGKLKEIILGFGETDFHHLAGLHKLRDISIARENRQAVFRDILAGHITYQTIEKSIFVSESRSRLEAFQFIEDLLDGEQLVFRFNKNWAAEKLSFNMID